MSTFREDVQLLSDLQALITEAEKTAEMSPVTQMAVKKFLPGSKDIMPEAQKQAKHRVEVLTRAKNRLAELMEAVQAK